MIKMMISCCPIQTALLEFALLCANVVAQQMCVSQRIDAQVQLVARQIVKIGALLRNKNGARNARGNTVPGVPTVLVGKLLC